MRKWLIVFVIALALVVTGCDKDKDNKNSNDTGKQESKEEVMTCTRTVNQDNLQLSLEYKVTYQGDYVKSIQSVEKITTEDQEMLNTYKDILENGYASYSKLDYYDADLTVDENSLTSTVNIDYENIDVDKLIEIDSANSQIIKDGKIALKDVKALYDQVGATCDK